MNSVLALQALAPADTRNIPGRPAFSLSSLLSISCCK
jgi:hypothetical protein